jgi:HSP20 family molecular chaperone IbpA
MNTHSSKELKIKEKQELSGNVEHTRPGLVFTPDVDIFETDQALTLLADMPGVTPDALTIDLRDDTLTISGETSVPENDGEAQLMTEYDTGTYYRQFSLSEIIDQQKIDAQLKDGVLRLTLPKIEKAAPRKITIKSE